MAKKRAAARLAAFKKRKTTKKTIAKVVRSVINKTAETKRFGTYNVQNLLDGALDGASCVNPMGNGTGDGARIGNKIYIKGFSIKTKMIHAAAQNITCHQALIWSDYQYAGGAVPTSTFIKNTGSDNDLWRFDSEKCRVIYRRKMFTNAYNSNYAGQDKKHMMSHYAKINKTFTFNPTSGYGLIGNFYVITWVNIPGGGLVTCQVITDVQLYYQDI